jgi:chemotaxis protein methyltransferase CheR
LYQQGHYAEAADTLTASFLRSAPDPQAFSLLARALANQGKLTDALACCERWIAADKLDPAGHYLRAVVLLEWGDAEQAHVSLQRTLYLRPEFVLAHFALGNLARGRGKNAEAARHFANALKALRRHQSSDLLPESDGLSAGRLTEIITSMTAVEKVPWET